jgi:hypothetical protein
LHDIGWLAQRLGNLLTAFMAEQPDELYLVINLAACLFGTLAGFRAIVCKNMSCAG